MAAGKLIAAIQKEWTAEMGTATSKASERVMHASHDLLQAAKVHGSIASVIGAGSVASFLGNTWVQAHPSVLPYIGTLEAAQQAEHG
jgi:hypothetical protein